MTARNPHDVCSVISAGRWFRLSPTPHSLATSHISIQKHEGRRSPATANPPPENQFWKRKHETMRLLLCSLSLFCLLAVISAKKQIQENIDPIEAETKTHSSKKYSKEYQKAHHHGGHKHKKHQVLDQPKEVDPEPKPAHADIPEPEIQLQSDIETSKKAIEQQKQKAEVEDLHLQDLTYEENLKKDKKKKKGHHHAENVEKPHKEKDQKLFADQEEKNPIEEKVIEDSFEPLQETRNEAERKNKGKDKKPKDKTKNKKKAFEKNKDKSKKSKDGKKKNNKDKKNKNNKDKKKW